jgi:DNA helicase-2/ATP-dependent DNA helicase PcrA
VVDYLEQLNQVQKEAVTYTSGPSLVIAGAGSGKTRVLTFRIAYLLSKGVPPYKILALTFTNKAAKEMKERIAKIIDPQLANQLWMGTFHSIFSKILRYEAENLKYSSNYTIYDTEDSRGLIKKIIKDLKLDDQTYKTNEIQSRISMAKNNLITSKAYVGNSTIMANDQNSKKPMIGDIYRNYDLRCKKADAMDFDDLLLNTNVLFRDFPDVLEKYQKRFDYVLVDEYQDTNFSQYLIVTKLVSNHKNLCVVGDDAQSIYSFRGAKIENILNFRKDFPEYNLYKLEQNYRSTQTIVNAANSIITKNRDQIKKEVYSKNESGEKIKVLKAFTDSEEGVKVAADIVDRKYQNQFENKDFAILYRTNAQSRIFEESLRRKNIPYRIYGSISFYQRKEIKDILAYYRLIINNKDDVALKRIINYPARGIGQTTINRLEEISVNQNISIWEVIKTPAFLKDRFNSGTITKLTKFRTLIDDFLPLLNSLNAYELAKEVATKAGIVNDLFNEKRGRAKNKIRAW